jgi:hypothetical protein
MIRAVRYLLILMAIVLYVPWRVWMLGGWMADKRGQRRRA